MFVIKFPATAFAMLWLVSLGAFGMTIKEADMGLAGAQKAAIKLGTFSQLPKLRHSPPFLPPPPLRSKGSFKALPPKENS